MKFADLLQHIADLPTFRTAMLLNGEESAADIRRQLDRWVHAGKIIMLRRSVYTVAPLYARNVLHPFVAANALCKASYVSLQSALAYYGMIPEYTPVTTSVTTRRPELLDTPIGHFLFRHVQPTLLFGFHELEVSPGQRALLATPEKALLDLLYLTPDSDAHGYLRELRLHFSEVFDKQELKAMALRTGYKKVVRAVQRLLQFDEDEEGYEEL